MRKFVSLLVAITALFLGGLWVSGLRQSALVVNWPWAAWVGGVGFVLAACLWIVLLVRGRRARAHRHQSRPISKYGLM